MIGFGAGDLTKHVILETRDETSDGQGGKTLSDWRYVGSAWAQVFPIRAEERIEASGELSTVTHRIRLRFRSDLTARMRISLMEGSTTRTFLVDGPPRNIGEKREILEFLATEAA